MVAVCDLKFINTAKERGNGGEWISRRSLSIVRVLIYECEKRGRVAVRVAMLRLIFSRFASLRVS